MSAAIARDAKTNQKPNLVDDRLPTPLYHQVYLVLRNKILTGEYRFDAAIPSEQEASVKFGVSRITAKRALNELADDGYVKRERGRGTRVIYNAPTPPVQASVEGLLENLLAMGLETKVSLLSFDYVGADSDVTRALQLEEGSQVQRAVRVRRLDDEPFSHLTTFVPEDIGRSFSRDDLASRPLLALLERSGVIIGKAEQTISATLADMDVSSLLGLGLGSPLLSIQRIVYDQNERPVEFIRGLYRPDRYQYRMMLSRVGDEMSRSWSAAGE
ncbi:MAG: GntR family transcriptional regulator [Methyloligellaceae bacterium]